MQTCFSFLFKQLHPDKENISVQVTEHKIILYYKTPILFLLAALNLLDLNTATVPKQVSC